jgi:hypothetical protein
MKRAFLPTLREPPLTSGSLPATSLVLVCWGWAQHHTSSHGSLPPPSCLAPAPFSDPSAQLVVTLHTLRVSSGTWSGTHRTGTGEALQSKSLTHSYVQRFAIAVKGTQ